MRITKKGHVPSVRGWRKEVTCKKQDDFFDKGGCGCVLSITIKDLVLMHWRGEWGGYHYYAAVKCPQCGKYNSADVPEVIWKKFAASQNFENSTFDGFIDGDGSRFLIK